MFTLPGWSVHLTMYMIIVLPQYLVMYLYKRFHSVGFLSIHHLRTWNNTENVTTVFLIDHFVHVSRVNITRKDIANVPKGKYVTVRLNPEENRNSRIWNKLFQLYIILHGHGHDPYDWLTWSFNYRDMFPTYTMTSSIGNIFCVTGPLCGEFNGHRWIPLTKASGAELWCFLWFSPEQTVV